MLFLLFCICVAKKTIDSKTFIVSYTETSGADSSGCCLRMVGFRSGCAWRILCGRLCVCATKQSFVIGSWTARFDVGIWVAICLWICRLEGGHHSRDCLWVGTILGIACGRNHSGDCLWVGTILGIACGRNHSRDCLWVGTILEIACGRNHSRDCLWVGCLVSHVSEQRTNMLLELAWRWSPHTRLVGIGSAMKPTHTHTDTHSPISTPLFVCLFQGLLVGNEVRQWTQVQAAAPNQALEPQQGCRCNPFGVPMIVLFKGSWNNCVVQGELNTLCHGLMHVFYWVSACWEFFDWWELAWAVHCVLIWNGGMLWLVVQTRCVRHGGGARNSFFLLRETHRCVQHDWDGTESFCWALVNRESVDWDLVTMNLNIADMTIVQSLYLQISPQDVCSVIRVAMLKLVFRIQTNCCVIVIGDWSCKALSSFCEFTGKAGNACTSGRTNANM